MRRSLGVGTIYSGTFSFREEKMRRLKRILKSMDYGHHFGNGGWVHLLIYYCRMCGKEKKIFKLL